MMYLVAAGVGDGVDGRPGGAPGRDQAWANRVSGFAGEQWAD